MKKRFSLFIGIILLFQTTNAQTIMSNKIDQPYIDVTGSAEKEIVPDIIYIAFTLSKNSNEKNKPTIEAQEKTMLEQLRKAGIDIKNLQLSNTNGSDYFYWKSKERYQESKEFRLKVSDAQTVGKVFDILTDLKAVNMYIAGTNHTKMEEFKLEVKQAAVKAAKAKAVSMAGAIDEKVGKVLYIQEVDMGDYMPQPMYANMRMEKTAAVQDESYEQDPEINFQTIKLTFRVNTRFEIVR